MIGGASKYQTSGDRLWISKFVSGFSATAVQMKYRDQKKKGEKQRGFDQDFKRWKCDLCPICRLAQETQFHVIGCTAKRAVKYRNKTHTELSDWFGQQHTDPMVSQCISHVLHHNGTVSFTEAMEKITDEGTYIEAAQSQDNIGFHNFQFGRISKAWKFLQENLSTAAIAGKGFHTKHGPNDSFTNYIPDYVIYGENAVNWYMDPTKKQHRNENEKLYKRMSSFNFDWAQMECGAANRELLSLTQEKVLSSSLRCQRYWVRTLITSREYCIYHFILYFF